MDNDIKIKIFPYIKNYKNLKFDKEGLWSISLPNNADLISRIIINEIGNGIILDGMAGIGGNSISFCKYFNKVISVEIDKHRFNLLNNNINLYNFTNISLLNIDVTELFTKKIYIDLIINICDGYFFDPQWGGKDYKKKKKLKLNICNNTLFNFIEFIRKYNKKKIIFKLPFNYDLTEFSKFNYKKYNIHNYNLIIIY
jgi:16S rRNA G966 N2-methylase RsmD